MQSTRNILKHCLLGALLLGMSHCGLLGGGSNVKRAEGYRVKAPAQWEKTDRADSDVAYRLQSANVVTVSSTCERHDGAPLDVLTRNLLIGTRDIKFRKKERIKVDGVEGLHSSATAQLDGNPFWFEIFVVTKNRCIFDFTLVSPKKISSKDLGEFITFIKSFRYGSS